jgi:cytosine/adenosine deaminase-related metal-dependent hydrolase
MLRSQSTPYFVELTKKVAALGGLFNAHLHLDRAGTYFATLKLLDSGEEDTSHLSLYQKHALIPMVHASDCFQPDVLEARVESYVDMLIDVGTTRADTVVDVTADRVGGDALDRMIRVRDRRASRIDFRVGAYSPLGFRDDEPQRWALLEEALEAADFLGSLPERDDQKNYPNHIGFGEHCRRILLLAAKAQKQIHIHVDQQNHAHENGTESIIRVVRELGLGRPREEEPQIWLVHVISPSAYDDTRFNTLVGGLVELNIGVICCPSAAISMRQVRHFAAPTHNSMARVIEMLAEGVHVRIGSDNVCDITSPAGTIDLIDEIFVLANTVRYYDLDIMASLAAGRRLTAHDQARLAAHIAHDRSEVERTIMNYQAKAHAAS